MSKIKQAIGITLFESDDFGGPKVVGWGGVFAPLKEPKRYVVELLR